MGPSTKTVVGLDIEPGYVAAVQGAGEVVDVETLAGVLKTLFAEHKLARRVRIGVANQRIVMRTIDLPPLTNPKEIASAVEFQAQEHIPMPLEQAVLEHQVLGQVDTPD